MSDKVCRGRERGLSMERSAFCKYRLLALLLLSVAAIGIIWFIFRAKSSGRIRNILLISIDTCRADYLSCYGSRRKTTPNIDAIADEGILFENVVAGFAAIKASITANTDIDANVIVTTV